MAGKGSGSTKALVSASYFGSTNYI